MASSYNPFNPKFFALTALILSFPPIFTQFGKTEGLRLSLSLLAFYVFRGFVSMVLTLTHTEQRRFHAIFHTDRIFHFAEIPMSLMAIYTGLQWLPSWTIQPYETVLLSSSPIIILLEGLATMIIIISSGQGLSDFLFDRSDLLKVLLVFACAAIYGVSALTVFSIYHGGLIKALMDATLVAVALTLIGVLSVATLMIDHGVLTDSALLFLYITYNIWTITRSGSPAPASHEAKNLLGYLTNMTWSTAPSQDSLLSMVRTLFQMFSMEMVTGLFIQMSVFLMVSRIIDQTSETEDIKEERSFSLKEWLFNVMWPCYGKAILILIYTYAWLTHSQPSAIPWYIDPTVWRWMNIFVCLLIYVKHLMTPSDDEGIIWSTHED